MSGTGAHSGGGGWRLARGWRRRGSGDNRSRGGGRGCGLRRRGGLRCCRRWSRGGGRSNARSAWCECDHRSGCCRLGREGGLGGDGRYGVGCRNHNHSPSDNGGWLCGFGCVLGAGRHAADHQQASAERYAGDSDPAAHGCVFLLAATGPRGRCGSTTTGDGGAWVGVGWLSRVGRIGCSAILGGSIGSGCFV